MHPLTGDLSSFKDLELEEKIQSLTKKYYMSYNFDLKNQIASVLEDYNEELSKRRAASLKKLMDSRDKTLDKLIKVN
jgi:hypothetical protein